MQQQETPSCAKPVNPSCVACTITASPRYFSGTGIDIGSGADPLDLYAEFFPRMGKARAWDRPDGNAQFLAGVADASFDFVHSSHCLEHRVGPGIALDSWFRVMKPGGLLSDRAITATSRSRPGSAA